MSEKRYSLKVNHLTNTSHDKNINSYLFFLHRITPVFEKEINFEATTNPIYALLQTHYHEAILADYPTCEPFHLNINIHLSAKQASGAE